MQKHTTCNDKNRQATAETNHISASVKTLHWSWFTSQCKSDLFLQILQMSTNTIAVQEKNSSPARSLVVALKPPRRIPDVPLLQHDELPPREEVNCCRDRDELVTGHQRTHTHWGKSAITLYIAIIIIYIEHSCSLPAACTCLHPSSRSVSLETTLTLIFFDNFLHKTHCSTITIKF